MKKYTVLPLLLLLCLTLFTGCRAYTLTDYLPELIDSKTLLPEITEIQVIRAEDAAAVSLTEAADLNKMMLHVDGIQCARESSVPETALQYEILFCTAESTTTLQVYGQETFMLGEYTYLAVRGGMDLFYLSSLFNPVG